MGGRRPLPLAHAIALGLLQGPTELLPVSSSAHTTLAPWFAGWRYMELDPEQRKAFEVALHTGTAAALLVRPPWRSPPCGAGEDGQTAVSSGARSHRRIGTRLGFLAGALGPPALAGSILGGQIERRLGTPEAIAGGLLVGSVAMSAAEMYARKGAHARASAGWRDGLALGLAQALALLPGVSRSGATLATARARGFSGIDAHRLSWGAGLPIIAGAATLKGTRLARTHTSRELRLVLVAGAASALLSTLASSRLLTPARCVRLLPACTAYRAMLALLVIRRMRDKPARTPSIPKK